MPIYEFACPKCRVIFNFLSKRINPDHLARLSQVRQQKNGQANEPFRHAARLEGICRGRMMPAAMKQAMPDFDDPRVAQAMSEMERDMDHLDENNPKHMAHMMRKMKDLMPPGSMPKEMEIAIKRLEAGEDPEKIEADMGDIFDSLMGGAEGRRQGWRRLFP